MAEDVEKTGGMFMGNSHADGGIPIVIEETGKHIEVEGREPLIPAVVLQDPEVKEREGTNKEILHEMSVEKGAKGMDEKATEVHAGDAVICVRAAEDPTERKFKGTDAQIASAINETGGCNNIESGAVEIKPDGETVQYKNGGAVLTELPQSQWYHGTCVPFKDLSTTHLGSEHPDFMSALGLHFTGDLSLAIEEFADIKKAKFQYFMKNKTHSKTDKDFDCRAYIVKIAAHKVLKIKESDLFRDVLRYGFDNGMIDISKGEFDNVIGRMYWAEGYSGQFSLYADIEKRVLKKEIDINKIATLYKLDKLKGYDAILYLNEIESPKAKRWDLIIWDMNKVKVIDVIKENEFAHVDLAEFKEGGKIGFDPKKLPSLERFQFAERVRAYYPKVWFLGGNNFGNKLFYHLRNVMKRGYWLDEEKWIYLKWQSYLAQHHKDHRISGVVAMLKRLGTVDEGWEFMKKEVTKEIRKRYPNKPLHLPVTTGSKGVSVRRMEDGGEVSDDFKKEVPSGCSTCRHKYNSKLDKNRLNDLDYLLEFIRAVNPTLYTMGLEDMEEKYQKKYCEQNNIKCEIEWINVGFGYGRILKRSEKVDWSEFNKENELDVKLRLHVPSTALSKAKEDEFIVGYRKILVNNLSDIDFNNFGFSYSYNKDYDFEISGDGKFYVESVVKIPFSSINIEATLDWSLYYGSQESEVIPKENSKIILLSIKVENVNKGNDSEDEIKQFLSKIKLPTLINSGLINLEREAESHAPRFDGNYINMSLYTVNPNIRFKEGGSVEHGVRKVLFVKKVNPSFQFVVKVYRDGTIKELDIPSGVRFPFSVGQIMQRNVETWACVNGYLMDGKDMCGEEKIFGIRVSDVPQGHEWRMMYPNKFRK